MRRLRHTEVQADAADAEATAAANTATAAAATAEAEAAHRLVEEQRQQLMSAMLPMGLAIGAGVLGLGGFLWWRRRRLYS